ncbi:MAG TPA: serine/threonine-protein kinase [Actinoplanes sp.]|nr:serine/threonine-protein kinase [Actinoplanes sp.]
MRLENVPVTPLLAGDPQRLGAHTVLGRLGSGGMGTVYLAEGPDGRQVAIKVVRDDPTFLARFRSEVKRARQVPPFCTAAVLHDDLEHDPPYLVVEFVDGPSLAEVVRDRGSLEPSELYAVAVGVATALVAIHGAGVVHRDLKPANVLLAVGLPKVIDFGIARSVDLSAELTAPDQVIGTIGYLAPECLDTGARERIGPPADVFAWGVLVAFAATGRNPFGGDSPIATIGRILTRPPDLDGVPEPLRELVSAALAKDPAVRPSAPELLDSLLSAGRPAPELRRVALAARASGRPRRRVAAWAAAGLLVAGLLSGSVVALDRAGDTVARQDRVLAQRDLLDRSAQVLDGDPGLALRLAVSAERISPSDRSRAAIGAALATGYDGELSPDEAVYAAEFRADGRMVATAGAGDVALWSVDGSRFERVGALAVESETVDLSFSPDGRTIATAGPRLQLWDTSGAYPLAELTGQAWDGVQFSADRRHLLTVSDRIELWDVRDRRRPLPVWSAAAGTATRGGARLSPDGRLLAGVAEGELLTVWAVDGERPRRLSAITDADAVLNLAFSPDGTSLAAATVSDGVRLYDLRDPARPRLLSRFAGDSGTVTTVAFDPGGGILAAGGDQRTVGLWSLAEPATPLALRTLRRDGGWISSIDFTPDGNRLLTAGWQGATRSAALWRVTPFAPRLEARIDGPRDPDRTVGVFDGVLAVTSPGTKRIDFWDLPGLDQAHPPLSVTGMVRARLAGDLLYATGAVYDLSGPAPRKLLERVIAADPVHGLATVFVDQSRIRVVRVAAGTEPAAVAEIAASWVAAATFDEVTGDLVVAGDNGGPDSSLTVWTMTDPAAPRRAATLATQGGFQALEARGGLIVAGQRDVVVRAGGTVHALPRSDSGSVSVSLSADRTMVAVTGDSGTVLWHLSPAAAPLRAAVLPGRSVSAAFSPDGPLLAVGDPGGTTVWDVSALQATLRDPLSEACLRQGGLTTCR